MSLSQKTLELFTELLDRVQIAVSSPTFEQDCQRVITARREIAEALDATVT